MTSHKIHSFLLGLATLLAGATHLTAQGTAFTYQGRLNTGGAPVNGFYDLRFAVYDSAGGGALIGGPLTNTASAVSNGLFTVSLDFGAGVFTGNPRWLEIGVRPNGGGAFTTLSPRQPINATPYAVRAAQFGGAVAESQLPAVVPRLNAANTFSNSQTIASSAQGLLTLNGSHAGGTWINVGNSSTGGRIWNTIATGSGNGEGPGKLLVRDATAGAVRMAFETNGNVGIGTTFPGARLEVAAPDAAVRVRNLNDPGGGFILNSWSALQLGMFNPSGAAWGQIPANTNRSFFGVDNSGRVGTLTNTGGQPLWRNMLDDGAGNAAFAGTVQAQGLRIPGPPAVGAPLVAGNTDGTARWEGNVRWTPTFASPPFGSVQESLNVQFGAPNNVISNGVRGGTIGGGGLASVAGLSDEPNRVGGDFATVPGGANNVAAGAYSLAAGRGAQALHPGSFVWADSQNTNTATTRSNQFLIRASGGVGINATTLSNTVLAVGGHTHINDYDIYFRGGTDRNHGVGWYSSFASTNIDGPVLFGWSGGALATKSTGNRIALRWSSNGETYVNVLNIIGGADLAEPFEMPREVEPGDVVIIDEDQPGQLKVSERAYDTRVAGIVSGANGVRPGLTLRQEGLLAGGREVALSGRVYARADASFGAIKPGDLLTTSDTPGHAMRVNDPTRSPGAVIGKAMSRLDEGRGLVLVLVNLQ